MRHGRHYSAQPAAGPAGLRASRRGGAEDAYTPDSVPPLDKLGAVVALSLGPASRPASVRHVLAPPGRRSFDKLSMTEQCLGRSSGLAPGGVYPRPRYRGTPCALTAR